MTCRAASDHDRHEQYRRPRDPHHLPEVAALDDVEGACAVVQDGKAAAVSQAQTQPRDHGVGVRTSPSTSGPPQIAGQDDLGRDPAYACPGADQTRDAVGREDEQVVAGGG